MAVGSAVSPSERACRARVRCLRGCEPLAVGMRIGTRVSRYATSFRPFGQDAEIEFRGWRGCQRCSRQAGISHPKKLFDEGKADLPVVFVRNRLCLLARPGLAVDMAKPLGRCLDPANKVATWTPKMIRPGDYAWALFAKVNALRPGARAALEAKALMLVGARKNSAGAASGPQRRCPAQGRGPRQSTSSCPTARAAMPPPTSYRASRCSRCPTQLAIMPQTMA